MSQNDWIKDEHILSLSSNGKDLIYINPTHNEYSIRKRTLGSSKRITIKEKLTEPIKIIRGLSEVISISKAKI